MITVICPNCRTPADVPDSAAGCKGKCRICLSVVRVPTASWNSLFMDDGLLADVANDKWVRPNVELVDLRQAPKRRTATIGNPASSTGVSRANDRHIVEKARTGPMVRNTQSQTDAGAVFANVFLVLIGVGIFGAILAGAHWLFVDRPSEARSHVLALKAQADGPGTDDQAAAQLKIDEQRRANVRAAADVDRQREIENARLASTPMPGAARQGIIPQNDLPRAVTTGSELVHDVKPHDADHGADREDANDLLRHGLALMRGDGVARDYVQGVTYIRRAAAAGNSDAQLNMGNAYAWGMGVNTDPSQAMGFWKLAADSGNPGAMLNLSIGYRDGYGTPPDAVQEIRWLQTLVNLNKPEGMLNLGICFLDGQGVPQDDERALQLFHQASDLGCGVAMRDICLMYAKGLGVNKDPIEAGRWMTKAAGAGDAEAMWELGTAYGAGDDTIAVSRDTVNSRKWILRAADAGSPDALKLVNNWASVRRSAYENLAAFEERLKAIESSEVDQIPVRQKYRFIAEQITIAQTKLIKSFLTMDPATFRIDDDIQNVVKSSNRIVTLSQDMAKLADLMYAADSTAEQNTSADAIRDAIKAKGDEADFIDFLRGRLHDEAIPPNFPEVQAHENAGAVAANNNVTPEPIAPASLAIDDATAERTKQAWLDDLQGQIKQAQSDIGQLRAGSPERNGVANSIRSMRSAADQISQMDDDAVRTEIKRRDAVAEEQRQQQAQREQQSKDQQTARLHAKFPNWNGPWRTCPYCQGSGRDAAAEREANGHNAGVVGSMFAGTRTMVTMPAAQIPCDVCGGTGMIPDAR